MSLLAARAEGETIVSIHIGRWLGDPAPEEEAVLDLALAPVLDVGCGPARHTIALASRGIRALGIDNDPRAARLASTRGATVLLRSVFDRVPESGRWGSALLLDGNLGIGGDPEQLLSRVGRLLHPGGRVLVEADPPGSPAPRYLVRIEHECGPGDPFPWTRVGAGELAGLADATGYRIEELWSEAGRWFARMDLA